MYFPRSLTLFRGAGLFTCMMVGVLTFTQETSVPSPQIPFVYSLALVGLLVFGWAFWRNTRNSGALPSRVGIALLGIQIVLGLLISTELLVLVAAEIPFVLPGRAAFLLMGIQTVLLVVMVLLLWGSEGLYPLPGLSHLPSPLVGSLTTLYFIAWQTFVFSAGHIAASEGRRGRELARVNAELQATQELLADSSRMAERLQISRELHDSLGHHLTVLNVNLELAKQTVEGRAAEPVREAQAVTRLLLADVREVVSSLREDQPVDLRRAFETLAAGTPEPRVHLSFPEDLEIHDPSQAHALFRCAQEAITNAVRHARARNLWIELEKKENGIALRARDDGRGTVAVRTGNGLQGMRERLEEIGGRLEIESRPGQGFSLRAWTPLQEGIA
jgi:signal transduction histidine kinase